MRRMVGELGEYWGKIGLRIYLGVFCRYRPGMVNLFWASLCEHVWCGISWHALNAKASKVVVVKYVICLQGTP